MKKSFLPDPFQTFLALAVWVAVSPLALGEDRFDLAVGAHDSLIISSLEGQQTATFSAPSLAKSVTVGSTSFQVSYGRDANDLLTAILTPSSSQQGDLHFNVLKKSVDVAGHAVVTLTFSPDFKDVTVDPGYVGTVAVDSQKISPHQLADDLPAASRADSSSPVSVASTAVVTKDAPATVSSETTAPVPATSQASAPTGTAQPSLSEAPATLASQLAPALAPDKSGTTTDQATASASAPPRKLYWSEPVTAPDGSAPVVGINEIKLVEVHGSISVATADGQTLTGVEGMIVPSGSTVKTMEGGSAALFMGGVDSARLLPRCELKITQNFDGAIRKITIDLQRGAVFSRIGRRSGEKEVYEVRTAEGVEFARKSEMLTFRGTMNDLGAPKTTLNSGWALDRSRLLAWNPPVAGHGLISDVTNSMLGDVAPPTLIDNTYIYYPNVSATPATSPKIPLPLSVNQIEQTILAGQGLSLATIAITPQYNAVNVLQAIMVDLQPNNYKLNDLLYRVNSGTGTPGDVAFYNNLTTVFFGPNGQAATIITQFQGQPNAQNKTINAAALALHQDLVPFGTNPLTPF